jgi:hypothetical protein
MVISKNEKKEGIELSFPSRPAEEILEWIKSKGFGWSKYNMVWWRKFDINVWKDVHEYFNQPLPEQTEDPQVITQERPSAWIVSSTQFTPIVEKLKLKHPGTKADISTQIDLGRKIESEHTDDSTEAIRITFDHLWEDPEYYTKAKPAHWAEKELKKEAMQKEFWQMTKPEYRAYWTEKYQNWEPEKEVMKSTSSRLWYANRPDGSPTTGWKTKKLAIQMCRDEKVSMLSFIKNKNFDWEHKSHIENAQKEGKPVSEEVINEYPEFKKEGEDFVKKHIIVGTIPKHEAYFSKSINELATEEKIRNYVPVKSDMEYIDEQLKLPHSPILYDICLVLYNNKAGNHGDMPLERNNTVGEEFILKMIAHYIANQWDGKVVPEKQRFSFKWPGFESQGPELILSPKPLTRTKKPIPSTIEEMVSCLKHLVGNDDRRPVMKYVYRDDSGVTASDAFVLVHIPTKLGEEFKLYDPKTAQPLSSKVSKDLPYPNYKVVIPTHFELSTGNIDLGNLLSAIIPYENIRKIIIPETDLVRAAFVRVKINDHFRYYDAYKLYQVADALYCQGTRTVTLHYPETKIHPVVFKDIENEGMSGLVMPIEKVSELSATSFYVDLTSLMANVAEPAIKEATPLKEEFEYFTKENAPDNIKDRFGIAKEGYLDKRAGVPKTFIEKLPSGESVYSVDGKYVRDFLYSDFSQGGNDMAYPEFMPIGELWYEQLMEAEKDHIINHEKRERDLMVNAFYTEEKPTEALTYSEAHEIVKDKEDSERGTNADAMKKEKKSEPDKTVYTIPELRKIYSFENGFNLSELDLDNFSKGTHTKYASVGKIRGTYPNFEREPEHKGIIIDSDYKWFIEVAPGQYKETHNPYVHFKKGDIVVFKKEFRDKGETENFRYKLIEDPDGDILHVPLNMEIVPEISISVVESPESVPETTNSVTKTDYANEFELNKAIEALLDKKWKDSPESFSADELEFIKGYTGYGGLDKYGTISIGSLFEYFTPETVIEKMWGLAYKYGYKDGPICEPSCGPGQFFNRKYVSNLVEKHGYEINKYSARIAKLLYPEAIINDGEEVKYFEQLFIVKNYTVRDKVTPKYDLVIGNPPYGTVGGIYMGMGEKTFTHANNYIDYFILRGLDLLKQGGLLIFIIGAETAGGGVPFLDQGMNKVKEMINERGKLIDAYRLPSGVFSRTDVTSDIVVFRKR